MQQSNYINTLFLEQIAMVKALHDTFTGANAQLHYSAPDILYQFQNTGEY